MIEQAIYILLTILIPLKQAYHSSQFNNKQQLVLWAVYWAFFSMFKTLQKSTKHLQNTPADFAFLLFALWLYMPRFQVRLR